MGFYIGELTGGFLINLGIGYLRTALFTFRTKKWVFITIGWLAASAIALGVTLARPGSNTNHDYGLVVYILAGDKEHREETESWPTP